MNSKKINYFIHSSILLAIVITASNVLADEEVILESDEQAQEILIGKSWVCEWQEDAGSGTSEVVFEEVKLKKIVAKVKSSYCPDGWGKFKGKYKKGKIVNTVSQLPKPCGVTIKETHSLYKATEGKYYLKGTYKHPYTKSGDVVCK